MPLANCIIPSNGSERGQIIPLADIVKLKTLKPGRPPKRVKVLATDKGYESKGKRNILRKRGIRPRNTENNLSVKSIFAICIFCIFFE